MGDILVIKCNTMVKAETLNQLRQIFLKEKEEGVVVIPAFCDAIIIPEDVEIKVEGDSYGD